MTKCSLKIVSLLSMILLPAEAALSAWLPFLTDNPQPVGYQHWEFYLFSSLNKNDAFLLEPDLSAPTVEIDWGILPDISLHAVLPYVWSLPSAATAASGLGDTELGIKYRFIHETDWMPQVSIAPLLELPTGDAGQNLGNGVAWVQLPVWIQKSFESWTTYGGGGYAINSAAGLRNYFYAGWELQKKLNEKVTLGAEMYYQGAQSIDSSAATCFNTGGYYYFNQHVALLFSAGHSVTGQSQALGALGLYWTDAG